MDEGDDGGKQAMHEGGVGENGIVNSECTILGHSGDGLSTGGVK